MAHRPHRRQFWRYLTMGGGAVLTGGVLVWTVFAPVDPARRTPRSGDLLDTVPPGSLPVFAQPSVKRSSR